MIQKDLGLDTVRRLKDIKQEYDDVLSPIYGQREAQQLFLIALYRIDQQDRKALLLDLDTAREEDYTNCLERLQRGEPIQYIFERAFFRLLDLKVNKNVLIPRPETEELVQWMVDEIGNAPQDILELGTGSGCIALSLKQELPQIRITAIDVSEEALAVAQENARTMDLAVDFEQLNALSDPLPSADILVSNPPYIPLGEGQSMAQNVMDFEPHLALFVEEDDPLIFYRIIAKWAVAERGIAFVEIHEDQMMELEKMLIIFGLSYEFRRDLQGKYRMLKMFTK